MRWIFYTLLVFNLCYLGYQLALNPKTQTAQKVSLGIDSAAGAQSIHLLVEAPHMAVRRLEAEPQIQMQAECIYWGPLVSREQAEELVQWLVDQGYEPGEIIREEQERVFYWSYLEADVADENASDWLQQIKNAGVDASVIETGEFSGSIFTGEMGDLAAIEDIKARLSSVPLTLKYIEKTKQLSEFWVEHLIPDPTFDARELALTMARAQMKDNYDQKVCKSVASME